MTHLELVGLSATSDLIGLLRYFKGTATAQARNMGISNLWEKSYHDHGLRADDNHNAVARYIFNNPVRKASSGTLVMGPIRVRGCLIGRKV